MLMMTPQQLRSPIYNYNRQLQQASRHAIAVVLAGGRGSRLKDLTDHRAKPAVHFGGKFRVIDFALSNCINSGFRRINVMTQYKSHSLQRHMQGGWNFLRSEMGEFIDVIPAQQRVNETNWYQGTADALFQNLDILKAHKSEWVVILAGDHVYKMDYAAMLADHIQNKADFTIACLEVPRMEATGFGVMAVDETGRIVDFVEKPADPPAMPDRPDMALASMGVYIFNTQFLYGELLRDAADPKSSHDFGKDIIPHAIPRARVMAHRFSDSCVRSSADAPVYWRDIGTVDSYWEANIDLTMAAPQLDLYDPQWPIFSHQEQLPPAKLVYDQKRRQGGAIDSIISNGCVVSGGSVRQSLLFSNVKVASHSKIADSVLLPDVTVGNKARLSKVIVDRGCEIPAGLVVGEDAAEDARRFYRTDKGVVLINAQMLEAL